MNVNLILSFFLALFLAMPVSADQSSTQLISVSSGSIQSLDLNALKAARAGQHVSLVIDKRAYVYNVAYRNADKGAVEVKLILVSDASKQATFGIRGGEVSAFIQTPSQIYALGYSDKRPVIGVASTDWTTRSLAALPAIAAKRMPGQLEKAPVPGATAIDLDTSRLAALQVGEEASLVLPGLGAVRVVTDEPAKVSDSTSWQGHLADFGSSYTVTITWTEDGASGYIVTPQGDFSVSKTASTGVYIWNPTAMGVKHAENSSVPCVRNPEATPSAMEVTQAGGAFGPQNGPTSGVNVIQSGSAGTAPDTGKTVDLLVYYSPGMITRYGSVSALTAAVDNYVTLTNQAYAAAGLAYKLRRVGLKQIAVADNTSNSDLLSKMKSAAAPFTTIAADRQAVGADLVTILRPLRVNSQKSCGVAWVGGSNQTPFASYSSYMTSVVSDGTDLDTGKYYCDSVTMAHELGHNLGLMHDRATVTSQGGGTGVTASAYGYAVPKTWGTIMSYTFPHLVRFSNPLDTKCGLKGNEACGVVSGKSNSADNAAALKLTLPIASGFVAAASTSSTMYKITGVLTLNGSPLSGAALVAAPANAATCSVSASNGSYSCTAAKSTTSFVLSINKPKDASGKNITWTPVSQSVTPTSNQIVNFTGLTSAVVGGTFKYNGAPVVGLIKALSSNASQVACSSISGSWSCAVPPNQQVNLALSYVAPNKRVAVCTPARIMGSPGAGAVYTFNVACK